MDEVIILVLLIVVVLPLVLAITALVVAKNAQKELRSLQEEVRRLGRDGTPAPTRPPVSAPLSAARPATTPGPVPPPLPPELPAPSPQSAARASGDTSAPTKPQASLEVTLGGKVASFVGIAALVLGVVFFVGYAIQHGWIGPGMRIVLGLVCGGVLIALGHLAEVKNPNLRVFARVLTGGGAALMFFSVFAAHAIYSLIGPGAATAGLVTTAAAVMGLAVVYRSQTVAILGVLGAFITPLMIGGEFNQGLFPLVYIAVVNATVMVLGIRRNWQSLYNIGFAFTVLYSFLWLERQLRGSWDPAWIYGLGFVFLYFAQYTALSLVKLKGDRGATDQIVDMGRMLLASLLLMAALYGVLDHENLNAWMGLSFLAMALVHLALVKLAWRWLPRFKHDILVLLAGAVTFATLALPAQLDGVWVSLGWAIEGLVLAWFARQYKVDAFFFGGLALGLLGLGKSLVFDLQFYEREKTRLFFNARFAVSLVAAGMLGAQAWLRKPSSSDTETPRSESLRLLENLIIIVATLGFIFTVGADGLLWIDRASPWAWLSSSVALLMAGAFVLILAERNTSYPVWLFGVLLLAVLPLKLLLVDFSMGWYYHQDLYAGFFNLPFITCLVLVVGGFLLTGHFVSGETRPAAFKARISLFILSLGSGILIVTREIARAETAWKDTAITLWWASCAMILIFLGLRKRLRYLRLTGLVLFGITIAKVFLFDLSELNDLVRVAAFMGVGILLLVLSFTYQRIAPRLNAPPEPSTPDTLDEK